MESAEVYPHVHIPSNIMTISEHEDPELLGIRCKECLIEMPMSEIEWHGFVKWWIFRRGI
jgi:hypothetical protein